jgi:carbon-monoxide dehydrogenase medium subunit
VKPPAFEYLDPRTQEETLEALARLGEDAKILAGGQSLVPMLNLRLVRPAHLVDVNRVAGLAFIERRGDDLVIGATTRQRAVEMSGDVRDACPLLHETMPNIAHFQIRNRGTIGGSLSHADPAAELPAVITALGGTLVVRSARDERLVPADEFYVGYLTTALQPDELLVEIRLPVQPRDTGVAFREFSRRHGDFALAAAAACVRTDARGNCMSARVVLAGVAGVPHANASVEKALVGSPLTPADCEEAGRAIAAGLDPQQDLHASSEYRRELAAVLAARALEEAAARARQFHVRGGR